jgi:hypothetical protein
MQREPMRTRRVEGDGGTRRPGRTPNRPRHFTALGTALLIGLVMAVQPAVAQRRPTLPTPAPAPAPDPVEKEQPSPTPTATPTPAPVVDKTADTAPAKAVAAIQPRFELHVPSIHKLRDGVQQSNGSFVLRLIADLIQEAGSLSSEGFDVNEAGALVSQLNNWPDTRLDAVTYAPDRQGRPRWAIRFAWPLDVLHDRMQTALDTDAAKSILKDMSLSPLANGGYEIKLPDYTLAYLLAAGDGASVISSFTDVEFPSQPFAGTAETEQDGPSLIAGRLNLTQTEKDTGATWLSSIKMVTDVVYSARVDGNGDWVERVDVHWPPAIGLVAKNVLEKLKHTFFVPDEAFGAAVFGGPVVPGMLDGMAGFGPQMVSTAPGEFEMVGEFGPGPIMKHTRSEVCITVLPGTGFFPIPDLIIQVRAKSIDTFADDIRKSMKEANQRLVEREQPEVWHEGKAAGRVFFWNDGAGQPRGMMTPAVERTVLFLTKETDARQKKRDFLVIGITTTSPEDLVKRWVNMERGDKRRYLPSTKKPNGQLWINWRALYRWLSPYANIGLSSLASNVLLPDEEDIADQLTDGVATVKLRYAGLSADHQGPVPVGMVALPVMLAVATEENRSGSDLARERNATRKLKVLHHHATLFHKDIGRWPAEVAELDGYVDFAGNRHLLTVDKSAKQAWSDWGESFFGLFGGSDDDADGDADEEDDEEDQYADIDDSIYLIEWHGGTWRMGFAADTFDHLDKLYIDEGGTIHRVEKTESGETKTDGGSQEKKG